METKNPYMERTLGLLKPEALLLGFEDEIKCRIKRTGLVIAADRRLLIPRETAMRLYDDELEKRLGPAVRGWLIEQMTSGESEPMAIYGPNAPGILRRLAGEDSDPSKCQPGTIRFDFAAACPVDLAADGGYSVRNLIHAADPGRAEYELGLFFTKAEVAFKPPEGWTYRFPGNF